MLPSYMNTLNLTSLSSEAVSDLSQSFKLLPKTAHADGQYRLRRYSVIQFTHGKVIQTDRHNFMQTDEINHFQGNVIRHFESILDQTLNSEGFREMCGLFVEANSLPEDQEIEVHQMRIAAVFDETQVAPEGVHQDGFDCIALIGIDRHNIVGGEVLLYNDNHTAPFYRKVLENGEVAILDDHKLWHNAMPIRIVDHNLEGHMDVFVLTARKPQ
ncbi:2OG-Fe dioxygenase family protein [Vibrio sp. FNV 38]|nr:2OG-Fe dioxygenase family protein [Vibrio sp. FNV 38]